MIKVYDYYQEENKALEERFTLASERIYEIQNEAELCAPYACLLYTSPSPRDRG